MVAAKKVTFIALKTCQMINEKLFHPENIAVIGASNNISKPGGKIVRNLVDNGFAGHIYAVNPNETSVQGVPTFSSVEELPTVDLAVLAIAAQHCLPVVKSLTEHNDTKAFIIISAGFGETSEAGKKLEKEIVGLHRRSGRRKRGRHLALHAGPSPVRSPPFGGAIHRGAGGRCRRRVAGGVGTRRPRDLSRHLVRGERCFFRARGARPRGRRLGWSECFLRLAGSGLGNLAELGRMTERQLNVAFDTLERDERRRRADFIEDVALAVWGGDAAEARVKALRGPD